MLSLIALLKLRLMSGSRNLYRYEISDVLIPFAYLIYTCRKTPEEWLRRFTFDSVPCLDHFLDSFYFEQRQESENKPSEKPITTTHAIMPGALDPIFTIPKTMQAIQYHRVAEWSLVTKPVPVIKPHEVLIKGPYLSDLGNPYTID